MIGRTLGLLSYVSADFCATTTVTGGVECGSRKRCAVRARCSARTSMLSSRRGVVTPDFAKQQLAGPYTLAATVERKVIACVGPRTDA